MEYWYPVQHASVPTGPRDQACMPRLGVVICFSVMDTYTHTHNTHLPCAHHVVVFLLVNMWHNVQGLQQIRSYIVCPYMYLGMLLDHHNDTTIKVILSNKGLTQTHSRVEINPQIVVPTAPRQATEFHCWLNIQPIHSWYNSRLHKQPQKVTTIS